MRIAWIVSASAFEQPTPETWAALAAAFDAWPQTTPEAPLELMRSVVVDSDASRDSLVELLRTVPDAATHVDPNTRLDDADFAAADFVQVFPSELELPSFNEAAALRATGPCRACGLWDSFDVEWMEPLVVDDSGDGDVAFLPAGGLAVSTRLIEGWRAAGITGFAAEVLVSKATGRPSARWQRLLAERAVLLPCSEHSQIVGEPFCSKCGRAHGSVVGYTYVRGDDVDGLDVFARHPGRHTMLYLSQRALLAAAELGASDLTPTDVVMVCEDDS